MAEDWTGRDISEIQQALQKLLKEHNRYYEGWRRTVVDADSRPGTAPLGKTLPGTRKKEAVG